MISKYDAIPMIAVKNLEGAKKFYSDILGLEQTGSMGDQVATFQSGSTKFNLYLSQFAGTNKATALTWSLGKEFDSTVQSLAQKGVKFEHYDLPGMTREGDIHIAGDMRSVWLKDPDGNILSLMN